MTLTNHFEIKTDNGIEYVRCATLPDSYKKRLTCGAKIDRSKLKTLYSCCQTFDEYIEKDHFIDQCRDLLLAGVTT